MLVSNIWLNPRYDDLKGNIAQVSVLINNVLSTQEESDTYNLALESSGKKYGNIVSGKEAYVEAVGGMAQENRLNINKMTVDDIERVGSLYSMKAKIELQGDLYNIKNFVQQVYDSELMCRVNSLSYRLQGEEGEDQLKWMWREIDDEQLVPWWSIDAKSQITSADSEPHVLDANDLLKHGIALCYLEVEFIGTSTGD